jgi:hypothetical protein
MFFEKEEITFIYSLFSKAVVVGRQTKQVQVVTMGCSALLYCNYAARTA